MTQGTKTPLGVGIIGTGFGLMHLLGFRQCEQVRVVAVCQRTPGKAAAFAQQHSVPYACTDYRQVIAHPDVHVASIAALLRLNSYYSKTAHNSGLCKCLFFGTLTI